MECDSKFLSLSNEIEEKLTCYPYSKKAKQTLGKLQARAAQRELLHESKGTKTQLKNVFSNLHQLSQSGLFNQMIKRDPFG